MTTDLADLSQVVAPLWKKGHWSFGLRESVDLNLHTDSLFNVWAIRQNEESPLSEIVLGSLVNLLLEANPDYLIEYAIPKSWWMTFVAGRLMEKLNKQVYVVDPKNLEKFGKEQGRAILFVPLLNFGIEPQWSLQTSLKLGLEPTALVTLVDSSPQGMFVWETGVEECPKLTVGALIRRKNSVWQARDCPLCLAKVPLDGVILCS